MVDFDALATAACMDAFGEPCEFRPFGGRPVCDLIGVFDESYMPLMPLGDLSSDIGHAAQITTAMPVLGIRLNTWPALPAQDDVVTVRGISYTIREVEQDGEGWALLKLNVGP